MYIVPTGQLKILRNVPVDADYQNTIYFGKGENTRQASVFSNFAKFTIDDHSYQRVTVNKIRVGINSERLYDCNYLMFQNSTGFGSYMWFYAFIDSITYINNTVSEIEYTIDSLQTYLTYIDFNMCFVERQHTPTDNIGDNIVPEGLELGEQVYNGYSANGDFSGTYSSGSELVTTYPIDATGGEYAYEPIVSAYVNRTMCIVVGLVVTQNSNGTIYDGTYGATILRAYPCTPGGITGVNTLVQQHYADPDSIQFMYMCPKFAIGLSTTIPNTGIAIPYGHSGKKQLYTAPALTGTETLDGYLPINKKMYTYPYNYLHIDNSNGSDLNLRYEYFGLQGEASEVGKPAISIGSNLTFPLQVILKPVNYKGCDAEEIETEVLSINEFPMCSWNVDTFKVWMAQNAVPILINGAAGVLSAGASLRRGMLFPRAYNDKIRNAEWSSRIGQDRSLIGTIAGALSDGYSAAIAADTVKGNFVTKGANFSLGRKHFYFGRVSVQHEYAKIIDDYFTRYGYAIKKLQVPNLNARPEFTYVKTIGCTINGSVPADDERNICNIMDNGITFWNNPANVGQYGLNNRPV